MVAYLATAIFTPKFAREKLVDFISHLGALRHAIAEHRRAASIASLVGNRSTRQALALAKKTFRAIAMDSLSQSDFLTNKDTGLFQKTEIAKLGECDSFISHSWSDDPYEKWAKLTEFNEDFKLDYGKNAKVWLDKACINQDDIDASLACLPVFLSGCSQLFIVAGPTYVTRLWCVMELYTFVQMGGNTDRIIVRSIQGSPAMRDGLMQFDASKAMCYKVEDRQKLLAIIESSFGSFNTFNKIMRTLFAKTNRMSGAVVGAVSRFAESSCKAMAGDRTSSTMLLSNTEAAPVDPGAAQATSAKSLTNGEQAPSEGVSVTVSGLGSTLAGGGATTTIAGDVVSV